MTTVVRPALQRPKENYAKLNWEQGPMESQMIEERKLHATLCEVERGLFHVFYRMEGTGLGKHHLPWYQLGACASEARLLIEQQARECGFALVVWDDLVPDPLINLKDPTASVQLGA